MKIGIDLGNTLIINKKDYAPNSISKINEWIAAGHKVFIISRVNGVQRERSLKWIAENDLFNKTGIKKENLYYCWERRDKSIFQKGLKLDVFIDDRAEVLSYMENHVAKFLYNPPAQDLEGNKFNLINTKIINDWAEIEI